MKWNRWDKNDPKTLPPVDEEYVSTITVLVTDGKYIHEAYYALDGSDYWYSHVLDGYIVPDKMGLITYWAYMPKLP